MKVRVRTPDGRNLDRDLGPSRPHMRATRVGAVPLAVGTPLKPGLFLKVQYRVKKRAEAIRVA